MKISKSEISEVPFPIYGPSKRDRLLCCWRPESNDIISEDGEVLGQPGDLGEIMDILIEHHAILLTTADLGAFEEAAMEAGWQIYRATDNENLAGAPKVVMLSCTRKYKNKRNTGTIQQAKTWIDEEREITVTDLRAIRQLCDHLDVKAKGSPAAVSIETMRAHLPRNAVHCLSTGKHDKLYPYRRFPRAQNLQPGTWNDIHEYDLTSAFATQLSRGIPAGPAVATGSEEYLNKSPFGIARIRWRWPGKAKDCPHLLRQDREDTAPLGTWHKALLYWNIVKTAREIGYEVELDPDYKWPAFVWLKTSYAFTPWVSWITERADNAPDARTANLVKKVRNAGIGRFAMHRLEWKATTNLHEVETNREIRQWNRNNKNVLIVRLSLNNRIAYYRAPGRYSDTRLLHVALWCWQQTDYEVWRMMHANPDAQALAVYVDNVIFAHKLRVRPIGWRYKQLRGQHVIDDTRNIAGETANRHPGKKKAV
jgi:hypothetical protein